VPPVVRGLLGERDEPVAERDRALTVVASGVPIRAAAAERDLLLAEHSTTATYEDIFYCFRLLLGRSPNQEEWPGHSSRVGEDLQNVVSSYVTSREFCERGLLSKMYSDQVELVRLPKFSLFASNDDLAVGRHVCGGKYEPGVTEIFNRYVKSGMSVVDIGANIGYFTVVATC
jgi:hypothetical protein